jgi:hypothetical protein
VALAELIAEVRFGAGQIIEEVPLDRIPQYHEPVAWYLIQGSLSAEQGARDLATISPRTLKAHLVSICRQAKAGLGGN